MYTHAIIYPLGSRYAKICKKNCTILSRISQIVDISDKVTTKQFGFKEKKHANA